MSVKLDLYPVGTSFTSATRLREQLDVLQGQLSTGKRATKLSELGSQRIFDIALRSRISRLEGYRNSMDTIGLRLGFYEQAMGRLDTIESDARAAATPGAHGSNGINLTVSPGLSKARLEEVLALLNTDVNGRYLFGGSATDRKPVESLSAILDGDLGRDGFRTVVNERKLADAGADGRGRLTSGAAGAVVSLAEDGVHPFGFKLAGVTTDSAAVAVTSPAGAPAALSVDFSTPPLEGQTVRVTLATPDGRTTTAAFRAVSGTPEGPGEFQIGADGTATASSFRAALDARLAGLGSGELAAASTYAAADNFFNGRGEAVMRVDGPPFESATALVAADPSDTVFWYTGEDSAGPARQTVSGRIDDGTTVDYGVQANESGPVGLVRTLAAFAVESFPTADASSAPRFDAMATIQRGRLAKSGNSQQGSIEIISLELAVARSTMASVGDRHNSYKVQLQSMLSEIEDIPAEEVAVQLLALQTRLQASYEALSIINQMSLVNFIR